MGRVADLISSSPDIDLTMSPDRVLDDTSPAKASSNALLGLATGDSTGLISRISSMLGIGGKAAGGLVAAGSTLALAAFKKVGRASGGLDASTLASTLIGERREIDANLPTGMLAGTTTVRDRAIDTGTIRDRVYDRERADYMAREEVERAPSRAWWWLAALIPIALLGYWLYNRSRAEPVRAPVVTPPTTTEPSYEPERDTVRDQPASPPPATTPAPQTEPTQPQTDPSSGTQPGTTGTMQPGTSTTTPQPQTEPSTGSQPGTTGTTQPQTEPSTGTQPGTMQPQTEPGTGTQPDTMQPQSQPSTGTTQPDTSGTTPQPQTEPSTGSSRENDPPGAMDQPGAMNKQGGTVPEPPTSENHDLPHHSGGTPTSPKAGPTDTSANPSMTFAPGSVESRLQEQIQSPGPTDKTTWFELDRVTFAPGKSKLEAASSEQIHNVAEILKANPNVKVRVGGYTDSTGDADANRLLSKKRAEAVKQALVAQGVDAKQIDTKGFADKNKVEQTAGASQVNRRAAIRVVSRGEG